MNAISAGAPANRSAGTAGFRWVGLSRRLGEASEAPAPNPSRPLGRLRAIETVLERWCAPGVSGGTSAFGSCLYACGERCDVASRPRPLPRLLPHISMQSLLSCQVLMPLRRKCTCLYSQIGGYSHLDYFARLPILVLENVPTVRVKDPLVLEQESLQDRREFNPGFRDQPLHFLLCSSVRRSRSRSLMQARRVGGCERWRMPQGTPHETCRVNDRHGLVYP